MKTAAEYVAAVLPPKGKGSQLLLLRDEAEKAVSQALSDAERYRYLLIKALRNNSPPLPQANQ